MNYNQKVGEFGEKLACDYLKRKGYKIVDRNVKDSYQELDIIAEFDDLTIFIEVKTRTNLGLGAADEAIDERKTRYLNIALEKYCEKHKIDVEKTRLDLIAIDIDKQNKKAKIKHYKEII